MSTEIQCASNAELGTSGSVSLGMLTGYADEPRMFVRVDEGGRSSLVNPTRADFLAAVASELDVIVIPRADLPEVDGVTEALIAGEGTSDPVLIRHNALTSLALAEHLDANPPVDEEEVAVLVHAIGSEVGTIKMGELDRIARRLIAAGWKR